MAKFYGTVGYVRLEEVKPGVWKEIVTERKHCGDVIRSMRRVQSADQVNDNMTVSTEISILANPFACENFPYIRYVRYMGTEWKVTSAEVQFPKIILTLGGVYNGTKTSGTP